MFSYIKGTLVTSGPLFAIIDINGIGYEINIPITTAEKLPKHGDTIKLQTLVVYKEDSQKIYGFHSKEDKEFFTLLVEKVSGIGPRIALNIMSRLSLPILKNAIASSDVALLSKCPGIGKKTAERLIIELRDKVFGGIVTSTKTIASEADIITESQSPYDTMMMDAVSALVTLGYKAPDADKAARKAVSHLGDEATTETIIKSALN